MVDYGKYVHHYSLRVLAGDWHGGQSSALYAFCSSGTAVGGLAAEIAGCIAWCEQHPTTDEAADLDRLRQFHRFIVRNHLEEDDLEEHHLEVDLEEHDDYPDWLDLEEHES